jgi:hypothetical protein
MKISSFFFGFITSTLCVALFGSPGAALPQGPDKQTTLAKQSSIVFSGTVSQLGATSFADVPKSAQTIVVRVDSVLKKPSPVSLKTGDNVTVEVKDPSGFQEGTHATFYTEGWIFGSGVAVKELAHEIMPNGGPKVASSTDKKAYGQTQEQNDQELRDRLNSADFVVVGRVKEVHRWTPPKSATPYRITEHDPDWHEAVLEIKSVLKGGKIKGKKMVVRFPGRNDVAWAQSPKFDKNQRGIFCLNRDQVSGVPTAKLGGNQVNAYTCLGHGAVLPMAEEAHVRSLLKSQ